MPSTQTQLFPPPLQSKAVDDDGSLSKPMVGYLFTLQNLLPLRVVDTSGGSYAETPPPAGLNATTGQSNQNMEITYVKSSASGVFTLDGIEGGPYTLAGQFAFLKIKSDGTNWWKVG
jgi:hypothetical protein